MPRTPFLAAVAVAVAVAAPATATAAKHKHADDFAATANARSLTTALETHFTDMGTYEGATLASLAEIEPSIAKMRRITLTRVTGTGYRVSARTPAGRRYVVTRSGESLTRTCNPRGKGLCRRNGTWG